MNLHVVQVLAGRVSFGPQVSDCSTLGRLKLELHTREPRGLVTNCVVFVSFCSIQPVIESNRLPCGLAYRPCLTLESHRAK